MLISRVEISFPMTTSAKWIIGILVVLVLAGAAYAATRHPQDAMMHEESGGDAMMHDENASDDAMMHDDAMMQASTSADVHMEATGTMMHDGQ